MALTNKSFWVMQVIIHSKPPFIAKQLQCNSGHIEKMISIAFLSRSITCISVLVMAFTRLSVISRSSLFIQKRTMSSHFFPNVIDKLVSPVKELVEAVSENGQKFTGETEADQKEVIDWITQSSEIVTEGRLKVNLMFVYISLDLTFELC